MKSFLKKFHIRFFDWPLDFRVRLFHILAFGGIAISFFTVTISLIMGMWETAGLAAVLIVFSLGLILFTQRTGKYQIGRHYFCLHLCQPDLRRGALLSFKGVRPPA